MSADDEARSVAAARERLRRAAVVLGDLLPEGTSDDAPDPVDRGRGETSHRSREEELRRDVPPHHGG